MGAGCAGCATAGRRVGNFLVHAGRPRLRFPLPFEFILFRAPRQRGEPNWPPRLNFENSQIQFEQKKGSS